ncbi:MAG TPA: Wzz/FepE/Etk N-terminal domain-containing protein [Gaiella sp.]|nr:Wzz/FepE/Etk N-terminal domain-containing protein [Gaiella sp.]
MSERRTDVVDPDAEREVDLRSAWSRIAARWWLPVGGLVVGAILGVLVSLGSSQVYKAQTLLYLGQPFTPGGAGQIQSLATNPRTVSETIRSEVALEKAARAADMRLGQLRGNVTSSIVTTAGQPKNLSPLVTIQVLAPTRAKASKAADSLAASVIAQVSPYVLEKIRELEQQIANNQRQLAEVDRRIAIATQQQNLALAPDSPLSLTEKLLVSTNSNATINSAEGRRASIQSDLTSARQLLSLAENVERSRIVLPAAAQKASATSRRNAAAVGGLIGLLLGGLAAIVADPWIQRRSAASA